MRQILVNHISPRITRKRRGQIVPFDEAIAPLDRRNADLFGLDSALEGFEKLDARECKVIEPRYFERLSIGEIAEELNLSTKTVRRDSCSPRLGCTSR